MGSLELFLLNYNKLDQNVKLGIFGQFLVQNIFMRSCNKTLKRIGPMDICAKSEVYRSRGL